MTIYRVQHNKNYTCINNFICTDKRLSWKAKGIWLYAFSRPDDWHFHINNLIDQSTDGKDSVSSGLKELENAGYLVRIQERDRGRFSNAEWTFYEKPQELKEILPKAENPSTVFPTSENPPLLSTDLLLSKESSKQQSSQPAAFSQIAINSDCLDQFNFTPHQRLALISAASGENCEETISNAAAKCKQRLTEGYQPENLYGFLKSLIIAKEKPIKPKVEQSKDNRTLALEMQNQAIIPNGYFEVLTSTVEIGYRCGQKEPIVIPYDAKGFQSQVESAVRKFGGYFKKDTK